MWPYDQIKIIRLVTLVALVAVLTAFVAVKGFRVFTILFRVRARFCHMTVFLTIVTDLGAFVEPVLEIRARVSEIIVSVVGAVSTAGSTAAGVSETGTMGVSRETVVHLTRFWKLNSDFLTFYFTSVFFKTIFGVTHILEFYESKSWVFLFYLYRYYWPVFAKIVFQFFLFYLDIKENSHCQVNLLRII